MFCLKYHDTDIVSIILIQVSMMSLFTDISCFESIQIGLSAVTDVALWLQHDEVWRVQMGYKLWVWLLMIKIFTYVWIWA